METSAKKISINFTTLKSISILLIVIAHFYKDIRMLWVPAAFGLFIFSYSSSYFTSFKYHDSYDLKRYLANKIYRLGVNLLVINLFLISLFSIQGKDNMWNMKTLLSFFGLTGLLDWLRIYIEGPFGAGMWFLTLLLIFYAIYPILNRYLRKQKQIYLFSIGTLIVVSWLNTNIIYGHALWLTTGGFIIGFMSAKTRIRILKELSMLAMIAAIALIVVLNFVVSVKTFNFYLLLVLFGSFVLSVEYMSFPKTIHSFMHYLSNCVLEIYLIHTAIFIRLTSIKSIDFLVSLLCIISLSIVLAWISNVIKKHFIGEFIHDGSKHFLLSIRNSE
jgi:hypothetical protein